MDTPVPLGEGMPSGIDPEACTHPRIRWDRRVWHDREAGQSYLEMRLLCEVCKAPFFFHGLPVGELGDGPCTDMTKRIVRLPIYAEGEAHHHERVLS